MSNPKPMRVDVRATIRFSAGFELSENIARALYRLSRTDRKAVAKALVGTVSRDFGERESFGRAMTEFLDRIESEIGPQLGQIDRARRVLAGHDESEGEGSLPEVRR